MLSLRNLAVLLVVLCVYQRSLHTGVLADGELNIAVESAEHATVLQAEYAERRAPAQMPLVGLESSKHPYGRISAVKPHHENRPAAFGAEPSATTLKVFGVGLSRTGTTSLSSALALLGLRVIHFDADNTFYMPHSGDYSMTGMYDEVDAVFDLPTAALYSQMLAAYPNALFISSHRPVDEWFISVDEYLQELSLSICGQRLNESVSAADNCYLFTFLNRIHESVYGSVLPNKEVWTPRYNSHYAAVRAVIPPAQLLEVEVSQFSKAEFITNLCQFLHLSDAECVLTAMPEENTRESMNLSKLKYPRVIDDTVPAKSKFAYATLLADANANYFKQEFLGAVMVWCESVRGSYPSRRGDYDIVVLLMNEVTSEQEATLRTCIDRIIGVENFGRAPRGMEDTRYNAIIRAKFNVLQLTEYARVIFMDADQMVMRNMDHYFMRGVSSSKSLYALTAMHSPVTTSTFSVKPSRQAFVDIFRLFNLAKWTNSTGWFEYGLFNFDAPALKVSVRDILKLQSPWRYYDTDPDYSYLPLLDQSKWFNTPWQNAPWEFYCSWSDQGMLFYYYFLLMKDAAIIDGSDMDHELVHFVGLIKPWTLSATIQHTAADNSFQRWRPAIQRWQEIAKNLAKPLGHAAAPASALHTAAVRAIVPQGPSALRGKLGRSFQLLDSTSGPTGYGSGSGGSGSGSGSGGSGSAGSGSAGSGSGGSGSGGSGSGGTTAPHTTPIHTTVTHTTQTHTTHTGTTQTHTTHTGTTQTHTTHTGTTQTHTTPEGTTHPPTTQAGNSTHTTTKKATTTTTP